MRLNTIKEKLSRLSRLRTRTEWVLLVLALLLVGCILSLTSYREYVEIGQKERSRLSLQSRLIGKNIGSIMQLLDRTLINIRDDLPFWQTGSDSKASISHNLRLLTGSMHSVSSFQVLDADGKAIAASHSELLGQQFSEWRSLQAVIDRVDQEALIVTPPYHTGTQDWTLSVARRITDAQGKFVGLVLATIEPQHFRAELSAALDTPDMWASIAHGDGLVLMMAPERPGQSGRNLMQPGSMFSRHRASGEPENVFEGKVLATGENGLIALHTVRPSDVQMDSPLIVAIGRDLEALYAEWRSGVFLESGLFILAAVASLSLLSFNQRRRIALAKAEHKSARVSSKLEKIAQNISGVIYQFQRWPDGRTAFPYASEGIRAIYGVDPEHVREDASPIFAVLHPDDLERVSRGIEASATSLSVWHEEYRVNLPSGKMIWVEGEATPERQGDGSILWHGYIRDISDRRALSEALASERSRLQAILDGTHVGTWEWGVQTGEVALNERWAEILGYTLAELAPINIDTFKNLVHPDDLNEIQAQLERYFVGELTTYECETRWRHKAGHWVWVQDRGGVSRWAKDGKPIRMLGTRQDITERKRIENELHRAKTLLFSAINTIDEAFVIYDADDRLYLCNEQYRHAYAASAPVMQVGKTFEEIVRYGMERGQYVEAAGREEDWLQERLAKHREANTDLTLQLNDGRWLRVLERRTPEGFIVGFRIDVTPLMLAKQAAEAANAALQESEASMRLMLDGTPDAYLIVEPKGFRIRACNHAAELMLGGSREHIVGKTPDEFSPQFQPDGRTSLECIPEKITRALESRYHRFEWLLRRFNSEEFWAEVTISQVTFEGQPALFAAVREIGEIIEAKKAAESANVSKSRFLATMSHELRTPMNGILGMAQLLQADQLDDAERRTYARTILSCGETLLMLLNDVLDLSKIEAGKVILADIPYKPSELIAECCTFFRAAADEKGLRLSSLWIGEPACYRGDPHRIRQMLSNLIGNAIKFSTQGEVRIEARECERSNGMAEIEFVVIDTGIGIPADKVERLFKPFSQADDSITRTYGGTGLGLSIIRSLAEMMDGCVGLESKEGQGSRFWFRIRQVIDESRSLAKMLPPSSVVTAQPLSELRMQGHVLVVDDNDTNRLVAKSMLDKMCIASMMAEDGQQAVEIVRSGAPIDLILMDIQMPVLDGRDATRLIRQWEHEQQRTALPIIALTAFAYDQDRQKALAAGMDDFAAKPIEYKTLQALITKWLGANKPDQQAAVPLLSSIDAGKLAALVGDLLPQLDQNNFKAVSLFHELERLVAGSELAPMVAEAAVPMANLQFGRVATHLRRLALTQEWNLKQA